MKEQERFEYHEFSYKISDVNCETLYIPLEKCYGNISLVPILLQSEHLR